MKRRDQRCSVCGVYVVPHAARVRTDQGWEDGHHSGCADHPTAEPVAWDRRGADGSIALAYEYIRAAHRTGGETAVDALCANPDPALYPGATPGTLALARSYHRSWRYYDAPLPAVTGGLYS